MNLSRFVDWWDTSNFCRRLGESLSVVPTRREIFIDVAPDIRIRYRRSEPPPPVPYAITLEAFEGGDWTTVRLWDNADAVDEHHEEPRRTLRRS